VFRWPWSRKYVVPCPDGTTRTVYHRVDDVFPLHLKYTSKSATASVEVLKRLKISTNVSGQEQIAAVLAGVDRVNQSIQSHFRAAYAVYEASPCTELIYFRAAVEKIITDEQRLRSVETVISQAGMLASRGAGAMGAENANLINGMLTQALRALMPPTTAKLAEEMSQVSDLTKRWSEND
jgi:hypothetical protein